MNVYDDEKTEFIKIKNIIKEEESFMKEKGRQDRKENEQMEA